MGMWKKWVRSTRGATMIHSGFLIQALRQGGAVHRCINCGEQMFVKYASGLCPLCYNGRRELFLDEPIHVAAAEKVLAGVLDDPAIEVVADQGIEVPSE
jgi:hypothetical protein